MLTVQIFFYLERKKTTDFSLPSSTSILSSTFFSIIMATLFSFVLYKEDFLDFSLLYDFNSQ